MRKLHGFNMGIGLCSKKNIYRKDYVVTKEPHIQSSSAGILLWRKYYRLLIKQEKVLFEEFLRIKKSFIESFRSPVGYQCFYCGKRIYNNSKRNRKKGKRQLITIDHILPISKGGSILDIDNMVICCFNCNNKKGNKTLDEFLESEGHVKA